MDWRWVRVGATVGACVRVRDGWGQVSRESRRSTSSAAVAPGNRRLAPSPGKAGAVAAADAGADAGAPYTPSESLVPSASCAASAAASEWARDARACSRLGKVQSLFSLYWSYNYTALLLIQ